MEPLRPWERLPEELEHDGTVYRLDLSYGAYLAAADALQDERLAPVLRLQAALGILVKDPEPPLSEGLLRAVLDLVKEDRPKAPGPQTMDLVQDWGYICAAFQQAYGIDLYADKSIHILRFLALLRAIPKNTKLAEIIGIRAAEIPAPNKWNQKQIAELTRLKTLYALRGNDKSLQDGWAGLFRALEARAKKNG